jgi:hypothetical protein
MVQENGTDLLEKASCYKGVFYNYLSIGISLITEINYLLLMSLFIMHYTDDAQFNRNDKACVTIKLGKINKLKLHWGNKMEPVTTLLDKHPC